VLIAKLKLQDTILIYIYMNSTICLEPGVPKFIEILF